jgi:aliphatic sulfonates family ABC transporter substrate-binding protein
MTISRRSLLGATIAAPLFTPFIARAAATSLRIGYQKSTALVLLKQNRALDALLGPQGVTITWSEFPSGPPLLEALNAGAIDFGYTGDTPPIFAQAANAKLVYTASQPQPGRSQAILVREGGPFHSLDDLKGARVAVTKGSSAHAVLLRAVQKAGIAYADIKPVYLAPSDAAAAFRQGAVDAWAIWDPFYAIAQADPATRVLITSDQVGPSNSFLLASPPFVAENPQIVLAVIGELTKTSHWIEAHPEESARFFSEITGVPVPIQRIANARASYETALIGPEAIAQQQEIADLFAAARLIPRQIHVADIVWKPSA